MSGGGGGALGGVELRHGAEQLLLGERLGEVVLGAHHAAAGLVEHAVLGGQHDHRHVVEARVALDDGAGLVAVQAGHQDVAEDDLRRVVVDLRERVEAVLGQDDLVAALAQEDLGAAPDGVAVVDDQHAGGRQGRGRGAGSRRGIAHRGAPWQADGLRGWSVRCGPSRSLPCAPRIRGRSSSSAPGPTESPGRCHVQERLRLRRRSTRKSDTSTFCYRSQLIGAWTRMQRF